MPHPHPGRLALELDAGAHAGEKRPPLGGGHIPARGKRRERVEDPLRLSVVAHVRTSSRHG